MQKQIIAGLLLLALCGCIKVKDELTLNADGSGKVQIETVSSAQEFSGAMAGMGGLGDSVIYPPVSESEAQKFFPQKDFTVTATQKKADNGETATVIVAEFKNVNALLKSPYGRAHQLTMKIAGGTLTVQGVTGMEGTARLAEMKSDDFAEGMGALSGLTEMQKQTNEMRAEFRVTLPNAVSSATGARDGKTAAWVIERAKCKDAADFAQQLGAVCEAKCPADGLAMTPITPVRMGLRPFAELEEGVADTGAAVDTNKIAAAAKFVPYGLTVTRSLDLSGAGSSRENTAQLTGAVTLPDELSPQKWGAVELTEVVDAKGNDLKPADADSAQEFLMRARSWRTENDSDDEDSVTNASAQHVVSFGFRPPDWKVNEIARIKGSFGLQYFGGSQVVKLTNAIPAKWIVDQKQIASGGGFDSSEKSLKSDKLSALGLALSVQMVMAQGPMTMVMVQTKGASAALVDAQAFDANGRPWPTFLAQRGFGGGDDAESCQIIITGKPQPPLSLALLASGGGVTVNVPILLEHVSILK